MKRKRRRNEENYNFSPWKQFAKISIFVVVLLLIAGMYAVAAMVL